MGNDHESDITYSYSGGRNKSIRRMKSLRKQCPNIRITTKVKSALKSRYREKLKSIVQEYKRRQRRRSRR